MHLRLLTALRAAGFALTASAVAVAPALVAATPLQSAGAAVAATTGSLSVSPNRYVAGQAVRFQGNLGVTGSRSVHLQAKGNRRGDTWGDVPGSAFRTDSSGRFDFVFRAPAMVNVSYRVTGGGRVTNAYLFRANPQELTLTPVGGNPDYPFYRVRPGTRFTVVVDTTPEVAGEWGTPPPIPGRTVLLQKRVNAQQWSTIGTGTTNADGRTSFTVTAPASGTQVLRAREQRWTAGAHSIGWFASFPAYFSASRARAVSQPPTTALRRSTTTRSSFRPTASGRFGWGPVRYDYAWTHGQSLNSPPSKGNVLGGKWRASSSGTGRVTPFNGGLVLQSKFKRVGPGDRGSIAATLDGAARAHGRWEFRLQGRPWETGARPYRFRLELVPAGAPVTGCPSESVVLADFTMASPGMRFGVRSRSNGAVWRRTLPDVRLAEQSFNVAVEVGRGHITWFRDSNPIGTVRDAGAQLGVKLVPRLSLIGADTEMNGAQVNSDWQRAWSLRAGKQVRTGPALTRTSYSAC